ncbi:MAG TPA: DUF2182 domain-containing protein, partial [Pseudonocardia sp.]|nr:DUF2182 domain-containing protein [Pseudonocardia sp.]
MTLRTAPPVATRARADRMVLLGSVLLVTAAAWVALAVTGHGAPPAPNTAAPAAGAAPAVGGPGPAGHPGHHPGPGSSPAEAGSPLAAAGGLLAGWALMVVAMMLAPALPMLELLRRLLARRRHPTLLVTVGALAYLGVWTAVGAVLVTGDVVAARLLPPNPDVLLGAALVVAGGYQFTPAKDACLRACRSPRSFAVAHWRGERPAWVEVATVAGAYAAWCVGCCWALMA